MCIYMYIYIKVSIKLDMKRNWSQRCSARLEYSKNDAIEAVIEAE